MSGTSVDGIDTVLVNFDGPAPILIASHHQPFDDSLRARIYALMAPSAGDLEASWEIGNDLADLYADAFTQATNLAGLRTEEIAALGCHGQTIRHRPELGYSIQAINGSRLAEKANCTVVTDFRNRDLAEGGQGAPLAPAFHAAVLASPIAWRTVVNVGGIANLSFLPPSSSTESVTGYDCGPGNGLMDSWAKIHLGKRYDEDGAWARSGTCSRKLLAAMKSDPYFSLPPPKSTGKEYFNEDWLAPFNLHEIRPEDVQATLLQLTAETIAEEILRYPESIREIYLCGGGARNSALLEALATLLAPTPLMTTDALGFDTDKVEALAFAWLARQTCLGLPGNKPSVTGARRAVILGAIYPATRR